jgi:uncharacterized Fe-S center protein
MVKKLIHIVFILLVPMQAMAALTMDLKMQQHAMIELPLVQAEASSNHACHQEVSAIAAAESDGVSVDNQSNCNACALCMAFGITGDAPLLITADHLTQSVNHYAQTFFSADLFGSIKPPIL